MYASNRKAVRYIFLLLALASAPLSVYADTLLGAIAALDTGEYGQAYATLESMARDGDHEAEYVLCVLYGDGIGRPRDENRAYELCRRAAAAGSAGARLQLDLMYLQAQDAETGERLAENRSRQAP